MAAILAPAQPPRQSRVFARLARWQLRLYIKQKDKIRKYRDKVRPYKKKLETERKAQTFSHELNRAMPCDLVSVH